MKNLKQVNTVKPLVSFKAAFEAQPPWLQKYLRSQIMYRCDWDSRTTFHNKINGKTPVKLPEQAVIALLFAKHGIDAWSGEVLEIKETVKS